MTGTTKAGAKTTTKAVAGVIIRVHQELKSLAQMLSQSLLQNVPQKLVLKVFCTGVALKSWTKSIGKK